MTAGKPGSRLAAGLVLWQIESVLFQLFIFAFGCGAAAQMALAFVQRQYGLHLFVQSPVDMKQTLRYVFM